MAGVGGGEKAKKRRSSVHRVARDTIPKSNQNSLLHGTLPLDSLLSQAEPPILPLL